MGTSEGAKKGWTEESRQKRSEAMKRRWQDPAYRAKREALEADPASKSRRKAAAVEANARPEKRHRHSEAMKAKWAEDAEFRARHSASLKKLMEDQAQRLARSESMKQAWAELRGNLSNSAAALRDESRTGVGRERRRNIMAIRAAQGPVTPQEHLIALLLNDIEVPYFLHKVIGPREHDVVIPSLNVIIEVDGSNHSSDEAQEKDAERDMLMFDEGYVTLRVSHSSLVTGEFIPFIMDALEKLA